MKESQNFDVLASPLVGTNIIEASAGTGKTYAIAGIFLRLLLEMQLSISDILVVTFTVAATEELRDRIRRNIHAAIHAFIKGESNDPLLKGLIKIHAQNSDSLQILREALRDFDEAPIYTIHGFCRQILYENAFESDSLFDTELITDERPLKEEIIQDFWRRNFYEAPLEFTSYALAKGFKPHLFMNLIRVGFPGSDIRIIPQAHAVSFESLEPFRKALDRIGSAWHSVRHEVLDRLKDPGLNKNKYRNPEILISMMESYINSRSSLPLFTGFEKFTSSGLKKATNSGGITPEHSFFSYCEDLMERASDLEAEIEGQLLFLKRDIFRYVRDEFKIRKGGKNIQFYDDLLINLKEALEKEGGEELAGRLRKRYRAALIDEFQDTDPIQYAIFQNIFGNSNNSILFLIGDPKQSIYSFRGADLFAYMRASQQVNSRYTLTNNWRSEPDMINAVNTIFENPSINAFIYDEIPFERASAGDIEGRDCLIIDGHPEPPLHIWFLNRIQLEAAGAINNQGLTRDLIIASVTAEISRLLHLGKENRARIGNKSLSEEDIAVLVRENQEARLVQEALKNLGIPSVLHSTGNLFDTLEALEMSRVLEALAEPYAEEKIRLALTTNFLGINGEALELLNSNDIGWEEWIKRFRDYNDLWKQYGFIVMFRSFLSQEKVRDRLLSFPDGERRLTNVLHLMEVLHREAVSARLGAKGLIKWLARQRDPATFRQEEHELRLESDDRAVKIVTIHKSKGLEYPIVFCPFNWGDSKVRNGEFTYHDPDDEWRLNLVLDKDSRLYKVLAERENLAENIRLLYVSLTRAKNRCYLVWGPFKEAGTSSLAYILHPPEEKSDDISKALENKFLHLSDDDIYQSLKNISIKSDGAISLYELPAFSPLTYTPSLSKPEELSYRKFKGIIDRDRRFASFSYFLSELLVLSGSPPVEGNASECPDRDGSLITSEESYKEESADLFIFPKGAKAGNLIHDILEHVDFTDQKGAETALLVPEKLKQHGFDPQWQDVICRMINNVAALPLHPGIKGLTLSSIHKEERLTELEFYFPLNRLTPEGLHEILKKSGISFYRTFPEKIDRINFQPVRGFMKGFIDLVFQYEGRFYLLDWKSNYLGLSLENYRAEALAEVMRNEYYILQYYLYILALHQYLKRRKSDYDYERHFGGVFYVFLRGVDPKYGPDSGIFWDRPEKNSIEFLCKSLIDLHCH